MFSSRIIAWIFAIALIIPSEMAIAQFGIKTGMSLSSFYYPGSTPEPYQGFDVDLRPYLGYDIGLVQAEPQKPLAGWYISAFHKFQLSERFGIRPEVSFNQKGVSFSQREHEDITYKVTLSYLELPVSCSYNYLKKQSQAGDIYVGAYGAFNLSSSKVVSTHGTRNEKTKLNTVNDFDWGFHIGIDYTLNLSKGAILIDLRIFLGMLDLFHTDKDATLLYFNTHKTKSVGLNFSIGYVL